MAGPKGFTRMIYHGVYQFMSPLLTAVNNSAWNTGYVGMMAFTDGFWIMAARTVKSMARFVFILGPVSISPRPSAPRRLYGPRKPNWPVPLG